MALLTSDLGAVLEVAGGCAAAFLAYGAHFLFESDKWHLLKVACSLPCSQLPQTSVGPTATRQVASKSVRGVWYSGSDLSTSAALAAATTDSAS